MNAKKYYVIYLITNNVNGKIYIGKHETNNLDDNYFGSGKHLINALNKYGLENFTKTILFYCHNQEEMNLLEHCVVTPEFCLRKDVYNIKEGGDGGWNYVNLNGDRIYSEETKKKMSLKKLGKKNRTYGTHWWTNPATFEIRLFKDDEVPEGWFRKSDMINKDLKCFLNENQKGEMQVRSYLVNEILKLNNSIKVNVLMTVINLQLILRKLKNPLDIILSNDRNVLILIDKIENQYKFELKVKLINYLYPIYCKYGWEEVLKLHPFKCTVFAFILQCKKYAKGYDPLNRRNKRFPLS